MVAVLETYEGFTPACNVRDTVLDLLDSVPAEYLSELRSVVLTNSGALTRSRARSWSWWHGRKGRHSKARGLYHGSYASEPAWIELFVDQVLGTTPSWALRVRLVRSMIIGSVLFHEIGHHIHATHRPEHRERETVADEWKRRLGRLHMTRRHRLARLLLRPILRLFRRSPGQASPRSTYK